MPSSELIQNASSDELISTANGLIRYSSSVLEEIRRRAVDRFLSIPRGGLEVGGLLFGQLSEDGVTVLAEEEFAIDHQSGPSFVLSENDQRALAERLQSGPPPGQGETLQIVGWWHSHTRTDVSITEEDVRVHRTFFPNPAHIALIIKPFKFDPAQVALYQPNQNDPFDPRAAFTTGESLGPAPAAAPSELLMPEPEPAPVAIRPAVVPLEPAYVVSQKRRKSASFGPWLVALLIAACSACLIAALYVLAPTTHPAPPPEPIRLQVSGSGEQIEVRWDRSAPGFADVVVADLLIVDGDKVTTVPLGAEHLRSGSLAYVRKNANVEVRMRARSRTNELQEAVAHFVGPELPKPEPPRPVAPAPPAPSEVPAKEIAAKELAAKKAQEEAAAKEVERIKAELNRVNEELRRVKDTESKAVQARLAEIRRQGRPVPEPQSTPPPSVTAPVSVPPTAQPSTSTNPPAVSTPAPSPAPATSSVAPPAPVRPSAPARLTSGRAIWTGTLPRGGVLLWDGKRASSGTLTGRMPHNPSRIRAYPADLMESGIVVYTTAAQERIEAPSAANGWNLTTYRPDGRRARELSVLEAPGKANNWQRLMLRSEQRTVSVIVFEWDEIPSSQP